MLRFLLALTMGLIWFDLSSSLSAAVENSTKPVINGRSGENAQPPASDADLAALREQRHRAQVELGAIKTSLSLKKPMTDALREELQERQALLTQIVRGYDEQLGDLQQLTEARQRHADIVRTHTEWKGFPDPPPYSILLADQLWETVRSLTRAVDGLQSQRELLTLRFEQGRDALKAAEERLRQGSERLESLKDPAQRERERRDYDLAELRVKAASVMVEAAQRARSLVEEELAATKARLGFEQGRLDTVSPHVRFDEASLAHIRTRLAQEHERLEEQLEQTSMDRQQQAQVVQQLEQRLDVLRRKQADDKIEREDSPALSRAKAAVELAQARLDNLLSQGDLLQQLLNVVENERQLWESRFAIAHTMEPGRAREAYKRFKPIFESFHASREYLRQQAGIVSGQISEVENRLRHLPVQHRGITEDLLRAFREREAAYTKTLHRMDEAVRFMERWETEFKAQQNELPWLVSLKDWLVLAKSVFTDAWQYELFSVEDTIEVAGKPTTGRRSVTVGKLLGALGVFAIGYALSLYLARAIGQLASTRFAMPLDVANLIRQWSLALFITLLVVLTFSWARIPLTIFAFLGGAFAIGVGFGAQTLLKNIISGILLLIERPMRVGDIVEVDTVRGRVTSIGLRSSTIRDVKGTETLIPNSSFLERSLTNWTYTSRLGRFSIRIGAPYGVPSQRVKNVLLMLALQHSRVLKQPPPQVLLEEFGSQARIFALNYWLTIAPDVDPYEVASELRLAIEQQFEEAQWKVMPAA